MSEPHKETLRDRVLVILRHARAVDWRGPDPYDGLNSRVLQSLRLDRTRTGQLFWLQLLKRLPIDFRPLLQVSAVPNAKAIALAIRALSTAGDLDDGMFERDLMTLQRMLQQASRVMAANELGWGHHAPWRSRVHFAPAGAPNATSTVFASHALLDLHEQSGSSACLEAATAGGRFLQRRLLDRDSSGAVYLKYFPDFTSHVYNLSLLGGAFFARLARFAAEPVFAGLGRDLLAGACRAQRTDGAWPYGTDPAHNWVDGYHTGFNLVALHNYIELTGDRQWAEHMSGGYSFWDRVLMRADGAPRAFEHKEYPLDIHAAAQAIITYSTFANLDPDALLKARMVLQWTDTSLRRPDGLYGYQVGRFVRNMIPYFRWAQMWMLFALAILHRAERRAT